jgi:hypothetical protein
MHRPTIAAALIAFALPAWAGDNTTTITSTRDCYSHYSRSSRSGNWRECNTEIKIQRPDPPPRPNCAYLPNFGADPRCR